MLVSVSATQCTPGRCAVKRVVYTTSTMDPITEKTQNTGFNNQQYLLAALGYVWFIGVLIMIIKKNDPFVYQHSRNGTALFILSVLWFIWPLNLLLGSLDGC